MVEAARREAAEIHGERRLCLQQAAQADRCQGPQRPEHPAGAVGLRRPRIGDTRPVEQITRLETSARQLEGREEAQRRGRLLEMTSAGQRECAEGGVARP